MAAVLDKTRVTPRQLLFSTACVIQGSALLSSFVMALTGRESWISALLGFFISLGLVFLYTALVRRYPGKNLFGMMEEIFGRPLGRLVCLLYVFFFLTMISVNVNDVSNFVVDYIMPHTPPLAVVLTFLFVCGWAARKGMGGVCKTGFVFFVLVSAVTLLNLLLLAKDMDFSNLLPVFQLPASTYIKGGLVVASVPFGEILIFLMAAPLVTSGSLRKPLLWGLGIGAFTLLAVIVRNVTVLGNLASIASLPSYEAVRHIQMAEVITRVDILYALAMLFIQFFKVGLYFYAAAIGIAQLFRLERYTFLLPVLGALAAAYSFVVFGPSMENIYWGSNVVPVFALFFEGLLPLLALLVAGFRKKRREPDRSAEVFDPDGAGGLRTEKEAGI